MNRILVGSAGQLYLLGTKINSGGFGDVFQATQIGSARTVAVKMLRDYHNADSRRHFHREVQLLRSLGINGIIELLDYNLTAEPPFYVMPYMSGGTLEQWVGKLPLPNVIGVARWLTNLVLQLHSKNQLHRDIKPDNILLDDTGGLKIADFGLGNDPRFTMVFTGHGAGTAGYAAPEVAEHGMIGTKESDIYSLGATLFHLLTGVHPRKARSFDVWQYDRGIPKALRDVLLDMLRPMPQQRPNAQQLHLRFAGLNLEKQKQQPPTPPPQPRQQSSNAGFALVALGGLFLLAVGIAASNKNG